MACAHHKKNRLALESKSLDSTMIIASLVGIVVVSAQRLCIADHREVWLACLATMRALIYSRK